MEMLRPACRRRRPSRGPTGRPDHQSQGGRRPAPFAVALVSALTVRVAVPPLAWAVGTGMDGRQYEVNWSMDASEAKQQVEHGEVAEEERESLRRPPGRSLPLHQDVISLLAEMLLDGDETDASHS